MSECLVPQQGQLHIFFDGQRMLCPEPGRSYWYLLGRQWVSESSLFPVSHLYGFGLVDADAIVVEAKKWKTVPPQHVCMGSLDRVPK